MVFENKNSKLESYCWRPGKSLHLDYPRTYSYLIQYNNKKSGRRFEKGWAPVLVV